MDATQETSPTRVARRYLIGRGWGGVERGHNVHLPAIIPVILPTRSWCYTLNLLLERPTRSGCYALEFALGTSKELRHALLEFSRNVRRCNGQTLKGGTQTLDKCWDCWKDFIPKVSTKDPKTTLNWALVDLDLPMAMVLTTATNSDKWCLRASGHATLQWWLRMWHAAGLKHATRVATAVPCFWRYTPSFRHSREKDKLNKHHQHQIQSRLDRVRSESSQRRWENNEAA